MSIQQNNLISENILKLQDLKNVKEFQREYIQDVKNILKELEEIEN